MNDKTVEALCEVGRALGADEIIVCGGRTEGAPSAERSADSHGNVLLPPAERAELCKDCARGEDVLLLDGNGVLVGLSASPGVWSHAYDVSWWPCAGVAPSDGH